MKSEISIEKLKEHVALPDWERRLEPLLAFRGTDPYRMRALWNMVYAMYLTEAQSSKIGIQLAAHVEIGHFCGLHKNLTRESLRGIFGRLRGCAPLTNSISPVFTEYIEWIHPGPCVYAPLLSEPKAKQSKLGKREDLVYPFIPQSAETHLTPHQQLLLDIHRMVPRGMSPDIRDDLCQDLLVAVIGGETTIPNIPNVLHRYVKHAQKMLPKFGQVSWEMTMQDDSRQRPFGEIIGASHEHA